MMIIFISLILTIITSIIIYYHNAFSYWRRKGIPYIQPKFPLGNINLSFSKYGTKCIKEIYQKLKSQGAKYGGMYILSVPVFVPIDPEIIKSMLQKNFENFHDRGIYNNDEVDPLSANLFAIDGKKWKMMRSKMNMALTPSKLKNMFPTVLACSENINKVLEYTKSDKALDFCELSGNYNTDIIGSCIFGLECNSVLDPNTEFRKYGKLIFYNRLIDKLKLLIGVLIPFILRVFRCGMMNSDVTNYFMSVVKETIRHREKHKIVRNDLMDVVIKIKNNENINDNVFDTNCPEASVQGTGYGFTANEIAAVAFTFYAAGFEATSSAMNFCFLELVQNLEIQRKLRKEIHEVLAKTNGEITYDALNEMKYLDKVLNETFRKHPPVFKLIRICTKDFKIDNTDIVIEKGTRVIIPVLGLHSDPEYFPNPEIFDPERFSEGETTKQIPFTYMPFGEGPRHCIGMRFGIIQTKLGIVALLKNHTYSIHPKTDYPVQQASNIVITTTDRPIYLQVERDSFLK